MGYGKSGSEKYGSGSDGTQQIAYKAQVLHLLACDHQDEAFPVGDDIHLFMSDALRCIRLERKSGEEILAHERMLNRGSFTHQIDQIIARANFARIVC